MEIGDSTARSYFDQIKSEADIESLRLHATHENLYLEFKQKSRALEKELSESDKRNFSTALSGFANSGGGVQLWGVSDKAGAIGKLVPILYIHDFVSRLRSLIRDAVQPVPEGVQVRAVYSSDKSKGGFAVVLVPMSDRAPHRATDMAGREYYKRNDDEFYKLNHFDLEDMFGRRQRPSLSLDAEIVEDSDSPGKFLVSLYLSNEGRAIARYYGLSAIVPKGWKILETTKLIDETTRNSGLGVLHYVDNTSVLHPTSISYLCGSVVLEAPRGYNSNRPDELEVTFYAEGAMSKSAAVPLIDTQ